MVLHIAPVRMLFSFRVLSNLRQIFPLNICLIQINSSMITIEIFHTQQKYFLITILDDSVFATVLSAI